MLTTEIEVTTGTGRFADLSATVGSRLREVGAGDGIVHVFAPHATVGVALMEFGAGSDVVLVDTNVDNPQRRVRLSFLPG